MIILTNVGTGDIIQVTCSVGVTSIEIHASWMDNNAGTITPGNTNTTITNSTSPVTITPAVTSGHQTNIKTFTVHNASATATSITITHQINGGTAVQLFLGTLQPGYTIQYVDGQPIEVYDINGAQLVNNQSSLSVLGAVTNAQFPQGLTNYNTALQSQVTVAATSYYVANSNINLPASLLNGIKVGTTFKWRVCFTKTAAGTGAFSFIIYIGTNGTTSDTAEVTQALPASTAALDTMWADVAVTFTTVGSSGVFFWSITAMHGAATAVGFGVTNGTVYTGTVSSVNTTTGSLIFGLGFSIAAGGTLPTVTIPQVEARATNLD